VCKAHEKCLKPNQIVRSFDAMLYKALNAILTLNFHEFSASINPASQTSARNFDGFGFNIGTIPTRWGYHLNGNIMRLFIGIFILVVGISWISWVAFREKNKRSPIQVVFDFLTGSPIESVLIIGLILMGIILIIAHFIS
jgi:hypothetical protein